MQLLEYYKWEIELKDGTTIKQSAEGEEELFKFNHKNPNFKNIKIFKLISKDLKEFKLTIPEEATLIYFRRTIANTGNMFPKFQINMVGWQTGKGIKQITYFYPDGKIENTSGEATLINEFMKDLPKKNIEDVVGCSGCKPRLERIKPDEK